MKLYFTESKTNMKLYFTESKNKYGVLSISS